MITTIKPVRIWLTLFRQQATMPQQLSSIQMDSSLKELSLLSPTMWKRKRKLVNHAFSIKFLYQPFGKFQGTIRWRVCLTSLKNVPASLILKGARLVLSKVSNGWISQVGFAKWITITSTVSALPRPLMMRMVRHSLPATKPKKATNVSWKIISPVIFS